MDLWNGTLAAGVEAGLNGYGPSAAALVPSSNALFVADRASSSVSVVNLSIGEVVQQTRVGVGPVAALFDPDNDRVYVANLYNDAISVLNASSGLVATAPISTGEGPAGLALDPATGDLFVTLSSSSRVQVFSTANGTLVGQIPVGTDPLGLALDPVSGYLFVANDGAESVSVIQVATLTNVGEFFVGMSPEDVAFDNASGLVYVLNAGSSNVTVIDGSSAQVVGSIPTIFLPDGLAVDPAASELFVSGANGNGTPILAEINSTSGATVARIPLGANSSAVVSDPADGLAYVVGTAPPSLELVNATSASVVGTIPLAITPTSITYDATNGAIYVGSSDSSQVFELNGANDSLLANFSLPARPVAIAFDPTVDALFVAGEAGTRGELLEVDPSNGSIEATATLASRPLAVAIDTANGDPFVTGTPSTGCNGTVTEINGSTDTPVATYVGACGADFSALAFDPAQGEMFVTDSDFSSLLVLRASNDTLASGIMLPSGDPDGIAYDSADGEIYVALGDGGVYYPPYFEVPSIAAVDPATDEVVAGIYAGFETSDLAFDNATGFLYAVNINYSVSFNEIVSTIDPGSELVIGSVIAGASSVAALAADPTTGRLFATDPQNATVGMVSAPSSYPVTILEEGLPVGSGLGEPWNLSFNGTVVSTSVYEGWVFFEGNGTYPYAVEGIPGYVLSGSSPTGSIHVEGMARTVVLAFVPGPTATLTLVKHGVVPGYSWCAEVAGFESCSYNPTLSFKGFTPGTYDYQILVPSHDTATAKKGGTPFPLDGTITLGTTPVGIAVTYVWTSTITFTEVGLAPGASWSLKVGGVLYSSTNATISVPVGNGTHTFRVEPNLGYTDRPTTGFFVVRGTPFGLDVLFRPRA